MKKIVIGILTISILCLGVYCSFHLGYFWGSRTHGNVSFQDVKFSESTKELKNPYRGFYSMIGFVIYDYVEDYEPFVTLRVEDSEEPRLYLVQINLCRFMNGPISQEGITNIEDLFENLNKMGKQYIIRFLYDWEGNGYNEPEELNTVLTHMKQLEPILKKHKDMVFLYQGVFVGSFAEMHTSKHLSTDSVVQLVNQLAEVTDDLNYLSVRTPVYWRKITQIPDMPSDEFFESSLALRLGLFNDGMMGTEQDYGTYGVLSKTEVGEYQAWNREEELTFQNELCKYVPNGGEAVVPNSVNDLENAIESMETMHVSYLSRSHDLAVLNKWAETVVTKDGCYNNMDGLSYIERHLGYRLLIKEVTGSYYFIDDTISLNVTLQNVGFAPMYREPEIYIVLHNQNDGTLYYYEAEGSVRELVGGTEKEQTLTIQKDILLNGYTEGDYSVYFYLMDPATGWHIQLANESEETMHGYFLGDIQIGSLNNVYKDINFKELDWKTILGFGEKK